MQLLDVTGCRAEIIQPGMPLTTWAHINKPYLAVELSMYNMTTREPCGDIIENGRYVHQDKDNFGFGIGVKDGKLGFGTFNSDRWRDFASGYNSPVQAGKYVAPWFTTSVFTTKTTRLGTAKKDDRIYIAIDTGVSLKQFATNAIYAGVDTLVNHDGGASTDVYYGGRSLYSSVRTPYNALVFWPADKPITTPTADGESCPYAEPKWVIGWGSIGDSARWVQWQLTHHGFPTAVDGLFFNDSVRTLKQFQKSAGLDIDGVCGPMTRTALLK